MTTKQKLAMMLERADGEFVSGSEIGERLGLTRAAIWKCIRQLQEKGYEIEAVRNRGYRLGATNDAVSEYGIRKYLEEAGFLVETAVQERIGASEAGAQADGREKLSLEVQQSVTSTNDVLKARAQELPDWYTLVAASQSKGKGRRGRSFYSPADSGVYVSMLIRLDVPAEEATRITTAAAVAACRAIEECTDANPGIKWVNDVFVNGKKVCGILTEASVSMESGGLDWAVMGIGFNVYEPEGGFPEEISQIAGPISPGKRKNLRCRLAAAFIRHFIEICRNLLDPGMVEEYRRRSILKGHAILVSRSIGGQTVPAVAQDIDNDCRLIVRYADGTCEALSSGEVSIRMEKEPTER